MGNKLGRRRQAIDEKYTRPQGLYPLKDVDRKKLKKLILESKLAPCYPGDEECPICYQHYPSLNRSRCCMKGICTECFLRMKVTNSTRPMQCPFCKTSNYAVEFRGVKTKEEKGLEQIVIDEKYKDVDHKKLKLAPCYPRDEEYTCELEECLICSQYYPSLNRSRCCMEGICTECFLQLRVPNSTRPAQCPFCKTSNYAVEFRGVKTKEEKGLEQIEEQRVIEAKIRMRQQEIQDEEERMQMRQISSSSRNMALVGDEYNSVIVPSSTSSGEEGGEIASSQDSSAVSMYREDEFDLDLDDIMVMEAICLSIQENDFSLSNYIDAAPPEQFVPRQSYVSPAMTSVSGSSSPSGGLACAIAALAERQQTNGESSANPGGNVSGFSMVPGTSRFYNRVDRDSENYQAAVTSSEMSINHRMALTQDDREWNGDTTRTSYARSDTTEDFGSTSAQPTVNEIEGDLQIAPDPIVPEF